MSFKSEYVELIEHMGSDLTTVNSARVSFAKESEWEVLLTSYDVDDDEIEWHKHAVGRMLSKKDIKLVNYLAKHQHWTPFSQNAIQFRIKMPIFVRSQWFKHTVGFTRNEVSRRYVDDAPEFWMPLEWRKRAEDKKQGSGKEVISINDIYCYHDKTPFTISELTALIFTFYANAIEKGVAPEMARSILPQSMMTEFIETASLAAYARLVKLRTTSDAQQEVKFYACRISDILSKLFPISWKALMEN